MKGFIQPIFKSLLIALLIFNSFFTAHAQLATYLFTGGNGSQATSAATTTAPNIAASVMSKGSGLDDASPFDYTDGFNAYAWTTNATIDANDYYEFTITPDQFYQITLTQLSLSETHNDVDATGGSYNWTVRSSIDAFATDIQTPFTVNENAIVTGNNGGITTTNNIIDLTGGDFDNLTTPVTFRIYGYSMFDANTEWGIDDVVLSGSTAVRANILAGYDFNSPSGTGVASAEANNITAGNLTAGAGLTLEANTGTFSYNNWTSAGSINATDYYEFTITPDAGYDLTLTSLTFKQDKEHGDSPDNWQLRSSLDNFGSAVNSGATSNDDSFATTISTDLTGGDFDNLSAPITFRLYAFNAANSGRYWRIEDVTLNGTAQLDITVPAIVNVAAPANDTYIVSEQLNFIVEFDENVIITGTPRIPLTVGATTRYANYQSGSGTKFITFRYTVASGHEDTNGIAMTSPIELNTGTIKDINDNDATLTYTVPNTSGILIDGIAPTITGVTPPANDTYIETENLDFVVAYDENVVVTGTPRIEITLASGTVYANYLSGTGTSSITYRYTVQTNNNDLNGITMISPIQLSGGTLLDASGNAADLTYTLPNTTGVLVDAVAPTITSVTPPPANTYIVSEDVDFIINYDENVVVINTPRIAITLETGGTVYANYASGTGTQNITFTYTVAAGHEDVNGIVSISPIELNSGTLQDAAGNNADLTFTPPTTTSVFVDGIAPEIVTVTPPANDTYAANEDLDFLVEFDQVVNVTGTPRIELTLQTGGTVYATYAGGTGSTDLTFTYTIVAGNNDTDGIVMISPIQLNGGTILDANSNAADLTYTLPNSTGVLVDAIAPTNQNAVFTASVVQQGGSSVALTAGSAADFNWLAPAGTTVFVANGTTITTVAGDATSITAPSTEGDYKLFVLDAAGNASVASTATLTVDNTSPVADITYDDLDGYVSNGQTLRITATFDEPLEDAPIVQIALVGTNSLTLTNMTKVSVTEYYYDHAVGAGNGSVTVSLGTGEDAAGNVVESIPNSGATFNVDNTDPTATVTVGTSTIFTGDLIQEVTVLYNETMDTGTNPTITFGTSTNFSMGAGAWSTTNVSNDTWTQNFTHNGNPEEISNEIASVATASGAIDRAGNSDIGDDSPGFLLDTQRPVLNPNVMTLNLNTNQRETVVFTMSEAINITNGGAVTGFNSSTGAIRPSGASSATAYSTTGFTVTLESNANNDWTTATTVSYNPGTGNIVDMAGNELATITNQAIFDGDADPPAISPDVITLFPNGTSPETLVFTLSEELDLAENADIIGFSVNLGAIASARYTGKGTTNTITLTSAANGQWDNTVLVSYTQAIGTNVKDFSTNEMVNIVNHPVIYENIPPALTSLTLTSNNANNNLARGGNLVTLTFSTNDGLNVGSIVLSNVRSGGVLISDVVYSYGNSGLNTYTAIVDIGSGDTDGALSFSLTFNDEAGNTVAAPVTQADITGQNVTVDNSAPTVLSIERASANPHNAGLNAGNVNFTVTFNEPVNNVDVTDFSVSQANLTAIPTVNSVNASSGTVFTVNVNGFDLIHTTPSGIVNLNLNAAGTITDNAGNDNISAVTPTDEIYTIINPEPAQDVPTLNFVSANSNSAQLSWSKSLTEQLPYQYLILVRDVDAAGTFAAVADGSFVANDANIGDGNMAINVPYNVATPYTVTGLNSGTNYEFRIYPYTNDGTNVNYRTAAPATVSGTTTTASVSVIFAGADVEPTTIASTIDTQGEAVQVFDFTIKDDGFGGLNEGLDDSPTRINNIQITAGATNVFPTFSSVIAGAELFDGTNTITATTVSNFAIEFNGINNADGEIGHIADNASKTYILRIWLVEPLADGMDNDILDFRIQTTSFAFAGGSSTLAGGQVVDAGSIAVDVDATELRWTTQPSANIGVLASFASPLVVKATDVNGSLDEDFNFAISSLTNAGSIVMNNAPTLFSGGIVNFPANFNYADAGDGTLTIVSNGLTEDSNGVTVSYSNNTEVSVGAFPEPATFSSLYTAIQVEADYVFDFTITDDATGVTVNDLVPTRIEQITIRPAGLGSGELETNWNDVLANAMIYDGSNLHFVTVSANPGLAGFPTGGSIGSDFITFTGFDTNTIGFIPDSGNKNYRLYLELKPTITNGLNNIIDNRNFNFSVEGSDVIVSPISSTMNTALAATTSGAGNIEITVNATHINFEEQPSTTFINEVMAPAVTVDATDVNGNRDRNYNGNANVTSTGTMTGSPLAVSLTNGVGTVPAITHTQLGNGLTLSVADNLALLTSGNASTTFNIIPGSTESDVTASSFTYNENIDYAAYTGVLNNTFPKVFEIDINDGTSGGTPTDADALPTNVTSISFSVTNPQVLNLIGLFNDSDVPVGSAVLAGNTITYNFGTPLVVPDNGSLKLHLRASYPTTVTDNTQFSFTVSNVTANNQGSTFAANNGTRTAESAATSSIAGDDNRIEVTVTQLVFDNIPSASINTPLPVTVSALDGNNNLDLDFEEAITSYTNSSITPGGVIASTNNPNTSGDQFTAGVYSFPANFQFTEDAEGVTISIETASFDGTPNPAGVSNSFDIISSFESFITFISAGGDIDYINYPPTGDLDDSNSAIIATYRLHDGNPVFYGVPDIDGASTVIDEITISITNHVNLDKVGLFDGAGVQYGTDIMANSTVTFTGINFEAEDDDINDFFIRASFKNTNVDITDNAPINIGITNVVAGGGSKFDDDVLNVGGEPDGLGGYIAPLNANNAIEVEATEFFFTSSPAPIEGVDIALDNIPSIVVRDANNVLDLDFSGSWALSTPSAPINITGISDNFIGDGTLVLTELIYTNTGDGTLTVSDPLAVISGTGNATSSIVDVINTVGTQLFDGIEPNDIPVVSGKQNIAILGFSLSSAFNNGSHPRFNELRIQFVDPNDLVTPVDISSTFINYRLFRSNDGSIDPTFTGTLDITADPPALSNGNSTLTFAGLDFLIDNDLTNQYYFLVVNVSVDADGTTPPVVPLIVDNEITMSAGSFQVNAPIIGLSYQFEDRKRPELDFSNLIPQDNALSVELDTDFTIAFDENVEAVLNGVFLHKQQPGPDDQPIQLTLLESSNNTKELIYQYLVPDELDPFLMVQGFLEAEVDYYITISADAIRDGSDNFFLGIDDNTTWNFRGKDTTPPNWTSNNITISNIDDESFSFTAQLNERSDIYWTLVQNGSGFDPDVENLFDIDGTESGVRQYGIIDYNVPNIDKTKFISNITSGTNFTIYLVAEDKFNNTQNEGTNVNGNGGNGYLSASISLLGVAPNTGVTVIQSETEVCVGTSQPLTASIIVKEEADNEFPSNENQVELLLAIEGDINPITGTRYNIFFDETAVPVIAEDPTNLFSNLTYNYLNDKLLRIRVDIGNSSNRDYLILDGLKFFTLDGNASGRVINISSNNIFPNEDTDNYVLINSYNSSVTANFSFDLDGTSVGNDEAPVLLLPDPSLIGGINTFSGNGVYQQNNNFFFDPGIVDITSHNITINHTDVIGCTATRLKTITVFDAALAIQGINDRFCIIPGLPFDINDPLTFEIIGETEQENFILDTLFASIEPELIGGFEPAYFDPNNPEEVLEFDELTGDYIFKSTVAGQFVNQNTVAIRLTGRFRSIFNSADVIELFKIIRISEAPDIEDFSVNTSSIFSSNNIDFCQDDVEIQLSTTINRENNPNRTETITMIGADAGNTLNDNGLGTAIVRPDLVFSTFGEGEYLYQYTLTNTTTTCSNADTLAITVNPKPIADFRVIDEFGMENPLGITGCIFEEGNENPVRFDASPSTGNITAWAWNFDDPDNSNANNPDEALTEVASHNYPVAGSYSVELQVRTDIGCESVEVEKTLTVGNNPTPEFTYSNIGLGEATNFEINPATINLTEAQINAVVWSFDERDGNGFGTPNPPSGISNGTFGYAYPFTQTGLKNVQLTVTSTNNCSTTITDSLFIVPQVNLVDGENYTAFFENDSEGWITWGENNSWLIANSGGDVITVPSATNGGSSFWVTGTSTYNENEQSYVYSPIFDLSNLDRPLVSLDIFDNINQNDGAVLEYSLTGFGTTQVAEESWTIVGGLESGINWYDERDIPNAAGRLNTINVGWSNEENEWKNARNTLSSIASSPRVQFRVSFKSGTNPANTADGLAFDNFFIGQRTRTVLVENFTNLNGPAAAIADQDATLLELSNSGTGDTELIVINYHTDFPTNSTVSRANPVDPNARAIQYNISKVPSAIVDGFITRSTLFSTWGQSSFELRTLQLANFSIDINASTADGALNFDVAFTPRILPLAGDHITVTLAIIEKDLVENNVPLFNVLRKLLPDAAGIRIPTATLQQNVAVDLETLSWIPTNVVDPANLAAVVFIQDETTQEIYQAEINMNVPNPEQITGVDELTNNLFNLYPNPANNLVNIQFGYQVGNNAVLKIYDNFGKVVFEQAVEQTSISLDLQEYASGMYHVQLTNGDKIERQRLIVRHADR